MKHTVSKPVVFYITCGDEVTGLQLQPVTFRRLIDITAALDGKELSDVLLNPTPLQIVTIAYCMLNDTDIKRVDDFALQINDKAAKVTTIQKLYYMVCENNIQDGYTNYTSLIQAVNTNITESFPKEARNKKSPALDEEECPMEVEEIFDIIGSNYSYTFDLFLDQITPRIASRMIEIIDIRLHNKYCMEAAMHGADTAQHIIKRPTIAKPVDKKVAGKLDKGTQQILKRVQDVKR